MRLLVLHEGPVCGFVRDRANGDRLRRMSDRSVSILTLGGTIAMTSQAPGGPVQPTLGADDLTVALGRYLPGFEIRSRTLAMLGSPQLQISHVRQALDAARAAVASGAQGVVVTQGTDTLEETAYLLDLWWELPEPLVLTGAMRSADDAGAEGLGNLVSAVRVAAEPRLRDNGVLVVMNDEVHLAEQVAKQDANSLHAFTSGSWGHIARLLEGRVHIAYRRSPRRASLQAPSDDQVRIPILVAGLADDAALLDAAITTNPRGIVIAAMGAGHVPVAMAEAAGRAVAAGIPVVFASRTGGGSTTQSSYGYPGSEVDLLRRGLIGAGWLDACKSRLLLYALSASGASMAEVKDEFRHRAQ